MKYILGLAIFGTSSILGIQCSSAATAPVPDVTIVWSGNVGVGAPCGVVAANDPFARNRLVIPASECVGENLASPHHLGHYQP